jgi:hypothetical protein
MTSENVTHLIRNCSWKFKCTRTWDSLARDKRYVFDKIRYCEDCKENVRLVDNESSLFLAIEFNQCVAIPFEITNVKKTLNQPLLGSIKIKKIKEGG